MKAVVHTCGDTGLLVELDDLSQVLALHAAIEDNREDRFEGLLDLVPAARTLLLLASSPGDLARLREEVTALAADDHVAEGAAGGGEPRVVEIPVHYDGDDLDEVGRLTGLGPAGVVQAHTGMPWTVGFGGFAPGFAYLVGGDDRLEVPRRDEPRTSVPAGAVGLAGAFSGIYPRSSPGGWQIIGHTELVLWDVDREPPALLQPGERVRFVDQGAAAT